MKKLHTPRIRYILMLIFAAIIYCSCSNTKRATKHLGKALTENRNYVLDTLRKLSPCVDGKIIPGDSTAYKEWKAKFDSLLNAPMPEQPEAIHDTVKLKRDSINCPSQQKVLDYYKKLAEKKEATIKQLKEQLADFKPIHDTQKVKDPSDSIHYMREKEALVKANIKLQKKIDFWMPTAIVCGILFLLLIAGIIISKQNNKIRSLLKAV